MELETVEQEEHKFVFKLTGAGHTFCNALKDELVNDDDVDVATYTVKHPMVADPKFFVETDDADPMDALSEATERLLDRNGSFKDQYESLDTEA